MKKLTLSFVLLLLFQILVAQTISNPSFNSRDESSLNIDKIEITDYSTIIYCTHTASDIFVNGGWVRIEPNIFIKETYGIRKYKLIKAEGVPLSPNKFNYSYKGQTLSFRLIFQKIANDIRLIDLIECQDSRSCFNFYGITIKKQLSSNLYPRDRKTGTKIH